MSKNRLYQLYDLVAENAAGPIMSEKRDGPAIRAFTAVLADPKTLPGQYPDHFALLFLGEQDDQSSEITAIKPIPVLTGAAWLAAKAGQNGDQLPFDYENEAPEAYRARMLAKRVTA